MLSPAMEQTRSHLFSFMDRMHSMDPFAWQSVNGNYTLRSRIAEDCQEIAQQASRRGADGAAARATMHSILDDIYAREFETPDVSLSECETQPILRDIASIFEQSMLAHEIETAEMNLTDGQAEAYPRDGEEYVRWLKQLISNHPASSHPFYRSYLPELGTREAVRYFLAQETSLDPRFDDILALIQLGTKEDAKLEIAANYWDEMGNGKLPEMHTILFAKALAELEVDDQYITDNLLPEAKLCGNLSAALALSRRHYYKAIGYFGVTEYLAPSRFRSVISAWERLGLSAEGAQYHQLHITVDTAHAASWFKRVIKPGIDRDARVGRDIAIGALIRLNTSQRYLDTLLSAASSR